MRKRKIGAVLLAVTMLAGILGGCGNNSTNSPASADTGDTVSTSGTSEVSGEAENTPVNNGEVIELTFFHADGNQEDPWTDPVAQAITEKTGVKLKTTYPIGGNDQSEAVALMIAEQKYPDLIFAKGSANYGDEFDKLKQSAEDPSIYQLSAYAVGGEKFKDCGAAQLQWDVVKANDYKLPETLDEFETMIKSYLADSPKTEDGLDRIGITLSTADWHWLITLGNPAGAIADGAPDNGQWIVDENNQAMYKFRSEKEREYFRWLCRMYNEGILDPEFATQTHEDYIAKIASGRVVALFDKDWDYQDGEKVLKADGKLGATYCGLPLTMDKATKSPVLMYQGLTTGTGIAISSSCADPVKAIQFIDFLCSDEGQVLTHWGVEDVNYFIDESGHRFRTDEEIEASQNDKDYQKNTGVGFHNYPFPTYGDGIKDPTGSTYTTTSESSVIGEYNEEERAAVEKWGVELLVDVFPQASEFEVPPYPPLWALAKPTEFDEIGNQLDEVAWSKLIECVIGSEADFDDSYDAMLAELEATGMYEAEAMLNEIIAEKVALTQ